MLLLLAAPVGAQWDPDTLNLVQYSLAAAEELRAACLNGFPALAPLVNDAYSSWPLARTKIEIKVNGVEYSGTAIDFARKTTREVWMKMPIERRTKGCEDFKRVFQHLASAIPEAGGRR